MTKICETCGSAERRIYSIPGNQSSGTMCIPCWDCAWRHSSADCNGCGSDAPYLGLSYAAGRFGAWACRTCGEVQTATLQVAR